MSRIAMSASLAGGVLAAGFVISPAAAHVLETPLNPAIAAPAADAQRQAALRASLLAEGEGLPRDGSDRRRGATARNLRFAQATGPAPAGTVASDGEALPAIEVTGQGDRRPGELSAPYAGGQVATGGSLGLLGAKDTLSTPFSTVNFTSKLIEDQQARTAADTLINDASVRLTTGGDGFGDSFQIRGFAVESQDVGLNGLYGLISSNRARAEIIERIELLKGPSAFVNGIPPGGSVGGSINIVTKRAPDEPLTVVTPTFIGAGNFGLHLDTARRFGDNKEWGVRFNGVARGGEASIENGTADTALGALGIDYRGERVRWSLDVISQHDGTDNFRPQISILPTTVAIPRPPSARSNWYPGTALRQKDNTILTGGEIDVTDWLTVYGSIGHRDGTNNQTFPVAQSATDALGNFKVRNSFYDSYTRTTSGNVGARAQFDTGFINHTINVGFTGFQQEAGNAYIQSPASTVATSNIYNPSPLPTITDARTAPLRSSDTTLTSFAASDTLSFADGLVLITAGARDQTIRADSFNQATQMKTSGYDSSKTSPLAGIVFKPLSNVSLYASYAEGLTKGTVVGVGYSNVGAVLAPYVSTQYETGVKVDWGTITTTAAVFQLSRPNQIRTLSNALAYDGEERNQGLELSAYGEIQPGLRGILSASFIKPELTKTAVASTRGNDASGVPDKTFSASLEWDTPWIPKLSLNSRVIYTSGSYLTDDNLLRFPDWVRVDVGARYATTFGDKPVVLRANVENLFDERYWLTTGTYATVGSSRTFVASASIYF